MGRSRVRSECQLLAMMTKKANYRRGDGQKLRRDSEGGELGTHHVGRDSHQLSLGSLKAERSDDGRVEVAERVKRVGPAMKRGQ